VQLHDTLPHSPFWLRSCVGEINRRYGGIGFNQTTLDLAPPLSRSGLRSGEPFEFARCKTKFPFGIRV
jgi:hypothetical protein